MSGAIGTLVALGLAIGLPFLAAKGTWWRGLWFGLCVPALLLAIILGSEPVSTKYNIEQQVGHPVDDQTFAVMNGMDDLFFGGSVGATLGFFIAGCVYRPKKQQL